jgi:hypothetical protein
MLQRKAPRDETMNETWRTRKYRIQRSQEGNGEEIGRSYGTLWILGESVRIERLCLRR